jgi:hypothetical protein
LSRGGGGRGDERFEAEALNFHHLLFLDEEQIESIQACSKIFEDLQHEGIAVGHWRDDGKP